MTHRPCPACGHRIAASCGYVNGIAVLLCQPCGTYFTADLGGEDPADQYDEYYTDENLHPPDFAAGSLDRIVAGFEPYRRDNRMLDVGFGGAGAMLAAARAGWDVEGVEVSEPAVKNADRLGLRAVHGAVEEVGYPEGHFDVVICSEVLEHVPNPRGMAEEIARILRPGGLLWATTPHGRGLSSKVLRLQWNVMCPPEHLQLFSVRGLRHLLTACALAPVRFVTENANPFEMVNEVRTRAGGRVSTPYGFDRVQSNYEILEKVYRRRSLVVAKRALQAGLRASRLGDSLKVWAVRSPATA
ncbi:MAG TPA: class I SAM-dependent methyltransferase [Acidimicrobiales bacterium]|nr:class I SAM-dependent methyltransferase [Acidimicrobiales bacterium]